MQNEQLHVVEIIFTFASKRLTFVYYHKAGFLDSRFAHVAMKVSFMKSISIKPEMDKNKRLGNYNAFFGNCRVLEGNFKVDAKTFN